MQRRGRSSEARLFGRANTERLAFLSAAAFVALIAGMGLMQGPGPRGAASASEPAQLERPARIIARDLPPAAAEIADQARNMERRPPQPPQAAKAATGADPAANAGDKSVAGQAASAPSVSRRGVGFASYVSYLYLAGSINDRGRLHLAISQTDDPTGAWNVYFLSYNQVLPDDEAIGVTTDKLTVSSNIFDVDSNAYFGVETLV